MTKHKVKFKKLKIQKSKLLVQNLIFSGDLALENKVSLTDPGMTRKLVKSYLSLTKTYTQTQVQRIMTTGHDSEIKKLPSLLSGGRYCKSVLQSGEAPLRNSMVGDFKHPRKYGITPPINRGGAIFPPPHCADRKITGWWIIDQKLDKLINMLSEMRVEQVNDGFSPSTEKIVLAASAIDYWSDFSPTLVCNWSPDWDKKLFNFYLEYSSSQPVYRATHKQGKVQKEVRVRRLKVKKKKSKF